MKAMKKQNNIPFNISNNSRSLRGLNKIKKIEKIKKPSYYSSIRDNSSFSSNSESRYSSLSSLSSLYAYNILKREINILDHVVSDNINTNQVNDVVYIDHAPPPA